MKPYYRKATTKDAILLANNLRKEDREELEGVGHKNVVLALIFMVHISETALAFFDGDDSLGGIGGIMADPRDGVAIVWMQCTPVVQRKPHTFIRHLKRFLEEQHEYRMLWNIADARNKFHHKLLKLLGFKSLRMTYQPPYGLPYLEIVKLCAQ
tara:strand:- start:69 stop:530 length:462 start_codon:yes stop_codon:yes gene_type:complete